MKLFKQKPHSEQTDLEEIANTISHGVGVVGLIVVAPFLIVYVLSHGSALAVAGVSVFIATAILLYLSSTIFHGLKKKWIKEIFRKIDHTAIFLLIAGTYTPFTFGVLQGTIGWIMFAVIWTVAIGGIILKLMKGVTDMRFYVAYYLFMGLMIFIPIKPLVEGMDPAGLLWLAAGSLAYVLGIIFYLMPRRYYTHLIWHLFVLAGTSFHFMSVMFYSY